MTDERLAEIEKGFDIWGSLTYRDSDDLIQALREEIAKVSELEKANSELKRQVLHYANIKMKLTSRIYELKQSLNYASDVITDMNKQLDAERAKVAELVDLGENGFKMYSALKLISNIEICENDKIKNHKLYNLVIIARQNLLRR